MVELDRVLSCYETTMKDLQIVIAGGTGFLGTAIADRVLKGGGRVTIISRHPSKQNRRGGESLRYVSWDADLSEVLECTYAVINLSGANVGSKRWSAKRKREIFNSRVEATRALVSAIARLSNPPALIQASAVGYYGNTSVPSTEAMPVGATFLSVVCQHWENEAKKAEAFTRLVTLRIGVVLDRNEGALAKLKIPTIWFIGGPLGSGQQWMPWVHREDVIRGFLWAALSKSAHGEYNLSAPNPVRMSTMARVLAKVLRRPSYLPVPSFVLRLILGEQADLLLHGQYIIQRRLEMDGFRFQFRDLSTALTDIFAKA